MLPGTGVTVNQKQKFCAKHLVKLHITRSILMRAIKLLIQQLAVNHGVRRIQS